MNKRIMFLILLIIIIVGILLFLFIFQKTDNETKTPAEVSIQKQPNAEASLFQWSFEDDESLNLDGGNQTNVYLEIKYTNNSIIKKLISTVPGGCSELPEKDADAVALSTQVQCYYAGLGYRYKIVKDETSYLVKRKTFEEALPDQVPPDYSYEVVTEFPLMN